MHVNLQLDPLAMSAMGSKADAQLSLVSFAEDVGKARAMQGARSLGVFKNAVAPAQAGACLKPWHRLPKWPLPAQGRRWLCVFASSCEKKPFLFGSGLLHPAR